MKNSIGVILGINLMLFGCHAFAQSSLNSSDKSLGLSKLSNNNAQNIEAVTSNSVDGLAIKVAAGNPRLQLTSDDYKL